jgi:hypothetical protein
MRWLPRCDSAISHHAPMPGSKGSPLSAHSAAMPDDTTVMYNFRTNCAQIPYTSVQIPYEAVQVRTTSQKTHRSNSVQNAYIAVQSAYIAVYFRMCTCHDSAFHISSILWVHARHAFGNMLVCQVFSCVHALQPICACVSRMLSHACASCMFINACDMAVLCMYTMFFEHILALHCVHVLHGGLIHAHGHDRGKLFHASQSQHACAFWLRSWFILQLGVYGAPTSKMPRRSSKSVECEWTDAQIAGC